MTPAARFFLSILLALVLVGLGFAIIGLRDADHRSRRAQEAGRIEQNLRIYRQRGEIVAGLAAVLQAESNGLRANQLRQQWEQEGARQVRLAQIIEVQLQRHAAIPVPWLLGELHPVDARAIRAELITGE